MHAPCYQGVPKGEARTPGARFFMLAVSIDRGEHHVSSWSMIERCMTFQAKPLDPGLAVQLWAELVDERGPFCPRCWDNSGHAPNLILQTELTDPESPFHLVLQLKDDGDWL